MARIAVNTRLLLKDKLEGIGWFSFETLKRITQNHTEHEFLFLFDRPYSEEFIFSDNITPLVIPPPTRHPVLWLLWFEGILPGVLKKHKADLLLSPDGYLPLRSHVPSLSVIHDINFAHFPQGLPFFTRNYYNYFFPRFAAHATRIATVSEYSKNDIVKTYSIAPEKTDVVYNGSNARYKPLSGKTIRQTRQQYTGGSPYFVFVGALLPRKNINRLLLAYDLFRKKQATFSDKVKLVIVGDKMFKTKEMEKTYNSLIYKNDVLFTGRLAPADLHLVLGSALALSFVPYFEGFGIPILEAMHCDIPVMASGATAMPEVCGNAALLVDPYSIQSISQSMSRLATEPDLRQELVEKARLQRQKFSWEKTADKLWESISKVLAER